MAEPEQGKPAKQPFKKKGGYRFGKGNQPTEKKTSNVPELKDDIFDVGATSDPAKFTKSLKNIENYIQKTYKTPDDIVKAIQQMKRPVLDYPKQPKRTAYQDTATGDIDEDAFEMAKFAWKEDYKDTRYRINKYNENESNAWALIYDQCTNELKNKLDGTIGYDKAKGDNDVIKLLTMIRGYCCQFDALNDEYMGIVKSLKNLFFFYQKENQQNADYHEDFMALVEVIEEYGGAGCLTHFPNLIRKELLTKDPNMDTTGASAQEVKDAKKRVRDKFLAALMLNGANGTRYGDLKRTIAENYVTGSSEYPESPEMVMRILNAYQPPRWNVKRGGQEVGAGSEEGAMFAQSDDGNQDWRANITCHKCKEKGHFARECGKKKEEGEQIHANVQEEDVDEGENIFVQEVNRGVVNNNYVLLDNQSTVDQIANPALLKNIRKSEKPIVVHCNAGSTSTDLEGELGSMTVKHNPKSIANVLSLNSVKKKNRVTYDSWDRNGVFIVHTENGPVEFHPSERGLHFHDTASEDSNFEYMLVNTVRENFEGYTRYDIAKAKEARRLQGMIGNPTDKDFEGMVREQLITNCPVTVHDIKNATCIFGPDIANLRGKTTRAKPERVRVDYTQIPMDFMGLYKYVTLVADVLFVNGLPFLVTSSRGIGLVTIEFLPSRTADRLVLTLKRVVQIDEKVGFVIQTALMDM